MNPRQPDLVEGGLETGGSQAQAWDPAKVNGPRRTTWAPGRVSSFVPQGKGTATPIGEAAERLAGAQADGKVYPRNPPGIGAYSPKAGGAKTLDRAIHGRDWAGDPDVPAQVFAQVLKARGGYRPTGRWARRLHNGAANFRKGFRWFYAIVLGDK